METLSIIEAVSTGLVCIGVPLIAIPNILGLYVMIFAQFGWALFACLSGANYLFGQSLFLLVFNFIGIFSWRRKGIGRRSEGT